MHGWDVLITMGDKAKAAADAAAAAEKEHRELMAALLKKFDILDKLEDRLDRIESTQKQMVLNAHGPEILQQRKKGQVGFPNVRRHGRSLAFP